MLHEIAAPNRPRPSTWIHILYSTSVRNSCKEDRERNGDFERFPILFFSIPFGGHLIEETADGAYGMQHFFLLSPFYPRPPRGNLKAHCPITTTCIEKWKEEEEEEIRLRPPFLSFVGGSRGNE